MPPVSHGKQTSAPATNLVRYSWKVSLSAKPESGGGLLLLRHVTPLTWRNVVYFCSGAYNSARANVLPFLETLGIIDHEGKPTGRAKLWRDDQHYSDVCKAIVKEIYPEELISAVPDPALEKDKAKSWFAKQTGVGDAAASRMVALYSVLVEADASKQPDLERKSAAKKSPPKATPAAAKTGKRAESAAVASKPKSSPLEGRPGSGNLTGRAIPESPEVNINLQIHISADASPDQIDQIFASMSKHLYGRG